MKNIFLLVALFISVSATSQTVIPLEDFNGFFRSFEKGFFRQITFQPIQSFKTGDNVTGYYDYRGNLVVYNGGQPKTIANVESEYTVSDYLLTWKIASTLNLCDNGNLKTLTYQVGQYKVSDSLVVFHDTRYNTMNVYYNGEVTELYGTIGDMHFPDYVGENILAFKDNGNYYKVFWRGEIYDLDVWHDPFHFQGGTDLLAFNDPINGTFAVFDNGEFIDVENFHMDNYKVGNGFVVYENQNGELMMYKDGIITELSNFRADFYDVRDNVIVWAENSFLYTYQGGEKKEVARYIPDDYSIKNDVIVFRNIMGGVSAFVDEKVHELTNQGESEYSIHGNSVLVELFNNSFIVLQDGKKYTL